MLNSIFKPKVTEDLIRVGQNLDGGYIINADQIIVLDSGKIVESGSHTELLEKDGIYKNLYNIQFNN